jgi:hypothetical protein
MDEFVAEEVTEAFKRAAVFETGNGVDELCRDNLML